MEGRAFVDRPSTRKFYCPGCRAVETDGRSARALIIYRRPIWIGFLLLLQSLTFGIGTVRWRYLGLFLALHILSCRHEAQLDFHLRSPPISRPFFLRSCSLPRRKGHFSARYYYIRYHIILLGFVRVFFSPWRRRWALRRRRLHRLIRDSFPRSPAYSHRADGHTGENKIKK